MHLVNRGLEPQSLEEVRCKYTDRWIAHYKHRSGKRPSDSYWRSYLAQLHTEFDGLCAYCESNASGEVDHFQPKSLFPHLVYCWDNWVFSCRDCNSSKGSKWPTSGYVDPCKSCGQYLPEECFQFDTRTGHILANTKLSSGFRERAQNTIDGLGLNDLVHLKNRLGWLRLIRVLLDQSSSPIRPQLDSDFKWLIARSTNHSSITRAFLAERGDLVDQDMRLRV